MLQGIEGLWQGKVDREGTILWIQAIIHISFKVRYDLSYCAIALEETVLFLFDQITLFRLDAFDHIFFQD